MRVVLARLDPARPENKLDPLAVLNVSEMAMVGLWAAGRTLVRVMRPLGLKPIPPWGCNPGKMDVKLNLEEACVMVPYRGEALLSIECLDALAADLVAAADTSRQTDRNIGRETQRSRKILAELEFALNAAGERAHAESLRRTTL